MYNHELTFCCCCLAFTLVAILSISKCIRDSITSPGIGTDSGLYGNDNRLSGSQLPWSTPFCISVHTHMSLKVRAQHCIHPEAIGNTAFVSLKSRRRADDQ